MGTLSIRCSDAPRPLVVADQANLSLASHTIDAYGRALEDYLGFCQRHEVNVEQATREHVSLYVHDLTSRPNPRGARIRVLDSGVGLANATMRDAT